MFQLSVTIYHELVEDEFSNQHVKTDATIPAWLKAKAEEKGVNFSRVLEKALLDLLGRSEKRTRKAEF